MVLDWFNETRGSAGTVADLIARKRYAQAIAVLRAQFGSRTPDAKTRLQLADLLVLAGRKDEAIPILVSLADEFSVDGFVAKAVAILKRIEKLEPGRADVETRLSFLVNRTYKAPPVRFAPPRQRVEIGIEHESDAAIPDPEPLPELEPPPLPAQPSDAVIPEPSAAEPDVADPPAVLAPPLPPAPPSLPDAPPLPPDPPLPVSEPTAPPVIAMEPAEGVPRPAVARRIRSILGRLLAARTVRQDPGPADAPEAATAEAEAKPQEPEPADAKPPEAAKPDSEPEAVAVPVTEEVAAASPEVAPEPPKPEHAVAKPRDEVQAEPLAELPDIVGVTEAAPAPPEATASPAAETAAEPAAAEPAAAVAPAAEAAAEKDAKDAAEEPETMTHRIKGFLGRFWPARRDDDDADEKEDAPAPEDFDLSDAPGDAAPSAEAAPEVKPEVAAEALEPKAGDEAEASVAPGAAPVEAGAPPSNPAPPETATEAVVEPIVSSPEPAPEPVAVAEELEELEAEPDLEPAPEPEFETAAEAAPAAEPEPPLEVEAEPAAVNEPPPDAAEEPQMSEEVFHERLLDVIEDVLRTGPRRGPRQEARRDTRALTQSPLLGALSEEERLKVVQGLRLLTYEPGDVVITEGEPGETLYLLTTGAVKVFVRNPASRNIEVRVLREGDFFGEVSILSGRPRTATITAASECELLELDRPTLDALGHDHPGIVDTLEAFYIERTQSADNAAVRAAAVADEETQRRATEVLRAHFGERAWDPKMRLKLADVLLKANKQQEALPILVDLADAMARQGHPEKAIAILKKIERIEGRHTEQINLAPLGRRSPPAPAASEAAPVASRAAREKTSEFFQGWIVDVVKDTVRRALPSTYRLPASLAASAGLLLSPLFEDFTDEEIQALIDGMRLLVFEAGDIVLTEGEPGNSVFVVTSGGVKVFVRGPTGHNAEVCELGEGDFFGEISTLSGRARSATVTAIGHTEVLELDKVTLEAICRAHPRVRDVLEEVYIQRAAHPYAAKVRGMTEAGTARTDHATHN